MTVKNRQTDQQQQQQQKLWRDTEKQSKTGINGSALNMPKEYLENWSYIYICLGKDKSIKLACSSSTKEDLGKVCQGFIPQ